MRMKGIRLPSKLYMLRKTFELSKSIRNQKSIENLAKTLLPLVGCDDQSDYHARLEEFWAREHAYYTILCKLLGKKYAEYLPGREYTYALLSDIIMRTTKKR